MKTIKEVIEAYCDLCGDAMDVETEFTNVSEAQPVGLISMKYEIWYGGVFEVKDVCKTCNGKLVSFLKAERMLDGRRFVK